MTCKTANDGKCDYAPCEPYTDSVDCQASVGCTDPHASNYQPGAFADDGSCAHLAHMVNDQIPSAGQPRTFTAWIKPECEADMYGNLFGYGDPDADGASVFALGVKCATPGPARTVNIPYSGHSYSTTVHNEAAGVGHGRGRLGSPQGWSAAWNNQNQWMQLTIPGGEAWVTGVVTAGRTCCNQWVTSYKISFLDEAGSWRYMTCGASHCIFNGNGDMNAEVQNLFDEPVYTTAIRIHPWAWHHHISMRAALRCSRLTPRLSG